MNLLDEPLIRVTTRTGEVVLSLPGVLERLASGEVLAFVGLQGWQEHSWFAFLVQLAAMCDGDLGCGATEWRDRLVGLAGGQPTAWDLVGGSHGAPAFLQPPIADVGGLGTECLTPDAIDILVTSKNHDVKAARLQHAEPDHWLFALVSLQTMQGYSGRNNYGIFRMNGGLGNRPYAAFSNDLSWGGRFERDVATLREQQVVHAETFGFAKGGHRLLWTLPWDSDVPIPMKECHPWCIEICRRIRLSVRDGSIVAHMGPSGAARVQSSSETGNVGDPWTPIIAKDNRALTLGAGGWRYSLLADLMFDREVFTPSATMVADTRQVGAFVGRAVVRGQGTTEGFHERVLPLSPSVLARIASSDSRAKLAKAASFRIADVKLAQAALAGALRTLLAAGGEGSPKESRHERWLVAYRKAVDEAFFEHLFRDVTQLEADEAAIEWKRFLEVLTKRILEDAIEVAPLPISRRMKAVANSESVLRGALRKRFPVLYEEVQP